MIAHARATHLDGVRGRFLDHFAPDELATLARWWDRLNPGAEDLSQVD